MKNLIVKNLGTRASNGLILKMTTNIENDIA